MTESLRYFLEGTEGAAALLAHAGLLRKLAGLYGSVVPCHLVESSRVANYRARRRTLVVLADTGAVAAKLRQMAPSVARELTRNGYDCTTVEVRVQAALPTSLAPAARPTTRPLSEATCDRLIALSDSLPTSPLRTALDELVRRAIRRE